MDLDSFASIWKTCDFINENSAAPILNAGLLYKRFVNNACNIKKVCCRDENNQLYSNRYKVYIISTVISIVRVETSILYYDNIKRNQTRIYRSKDRKHTYQKCLFLLPCVYCINDHRYIITWWTGKFESSIFAIVTQTYWYV